MLEAKKISDFYSQQYESEYGSQHTSNILNSILKFPGNIYSKAEALQ
jgi:hypothetical protein